MDDLAKAHFLDVKREEMKKGYMEAVNVAYGEDEFAIHKAFIMMACTIEKIMSHEDYKELNEYHNKVRTENFIALQKKFEDDIRSMQNGT